VSTLDTSAHTGTATPASRAHGVMVAVLLAALVVTGASATVDPDLFHAIALARDAIARGSIPMHDVFAFTPTREPVVHHEWLTGMILYPVVAGMGDVGLIALAHVMHLTAVAVVLLLARRNGASIVGLAMLGPLGIGMTLTGLTVLRAHVFTLVFVGILLWCLDADRRGSRRWLIAWIPLQVAWQNCHGGFVIGPILVAAHAAEQWMRGRPVRHLLALLIATPALTVLSPYGTAYTAYLWSALSLDRSAIGEWHVLTDGNALKVAIWALATLVSLYAVRSTGTTAAPGWLLVLVVAIGAFRFQRLLSIYGVVWLALVPPWAARARLETVFRRLWAARPAATWACLLAALIALIARDVRERPWELRVPTVPDADGGVAYPVGVVEYLRDRRVAGNMITPFEIGAFVSWNLYPAIKVSLDGRYEAAFAPSLVLEHIEFFDAMPSWRRLLSEYRPDLVLAKRTDPVVTALRTDGAWTQTYADEAFVLFARPGFLRGG
jgi:hypothetical protein